MKFFLTVIIPVYNESKRLHKIEHVSNYLKKQKYTSEIVVVNDGSNDDTLKKLKQLQKIILFRLITYTKNRGRGFAVKTAMQQAKGKYQLFLDVDLSTPIEEAAKFIRLCDKYDILIGSRKMPGAKVKIPQPFVRRNMGKVFTLISRVTLRMNISDFNCGFKFFSEEAVGKIAPRTTLERWGFDTELLYIAKKHGLKIKEIPVTWINDKNTTVRFPRDVIYSFKETYVIIRNDLRKVYD